MEASQKVDQFCNRQFYDLIESDSRYFVSQGGTRSGKTYAICQYIIYLLTTNTPNSETKFLISKLFDVISLILFEEIEIDLITLILSNEHKL